MYELDNRKDQVMTVFKVALVNVVMWTRDQYFPASYEHATWKRLAPFFHLPGLVRIASFESLVSALCLSINKILIIHSSSSAAKLRSDSTDGTK